MKRREKFKEKMKMKDWRSALVSPETTVYRALEIINESSLQVALVVDEKEHLIGTVTDGDVRRAILNNISTSEPVKMIMFESFSAVSVSDSDEEVLAMMRAKDVRQVPVLDEDGRIVDLKVLLHMVGTEDLSRSNWVVLMAGGLGSRLRPLTDKYPKPLLGIGGKPLLETIICNLREYGFRNLFVSINYKASMITNYFGDGSKWGMKIKYLQEDEKLGTAGSLSLLPERPDNPFLVMNCDLLTKVNFSHLMDFHNQNNSVGTMCVREYDFQIPYGVVRAEGSILTGIDEKPVQSIFVNAGIYVLDPQVLDLIPQGKYHDMPTVFEDIILHKMKATIFPIHEYWLDIGRIDDYEKAHGEYTKHFEPGNSDVHN